MQNFKKLLYLLSSHERKKAGILLIMITIMALLDMIGVASILPFMAVLANPSLIETNIILKTIFQTSIVFGVETDKDFLIFLGFTVFILLIVSLSFKALTNYVQIRFVQMREFSIGKRLVSLYLGQPYRMAMRVISVVLLVLVGVVFVAGPATILHGLTGLNVKVLIYINLGLNSIKKTRKLK